MIIGNISKQNDEICGVSIQYKPTSFNNLLPSNGNDLHIRYYKNYEKNIND